VLPPGGWAGPRAAGPARGSDLEQQPSRVLEDILDGDQELHRVLAVDDAVVVGQREVHHRPDHDFVVNGDWALLDLVHAEDRALRRIEDRRRNERAEYAAVGDGERTAGELLHGDAGFLRARAEVGDLGLDAGEALQVGVAYHRYEKPARRRHRDADVGVVVAHDVGAVDVGVDQRGPRK